MGRMEIRLVGKWNFSIRLGGGGMELQHSTSGGWNFGIQLAWEEGMEIYPNYYLRIFFRYFIQ